MAAHRGDQPDAIPVEYLKQKAATEKWPTSSVAVHASNARRVEDDPPTVPFRAVHPPPLHARQHEVPAPRSTPLPGRHRLRTSP